MLDGLPLALATAGSYLDQVATSFAHYLHLYNTSWAKLQQTSPELSSYEDRRLYSTWQLSFDHIRQQNELSAQLLQLWAYFDNQDLWFDLLQELNDCGSGWMLQLIADELSFNQAIRVLCDHGLIEVDRFSEASEIESKGYGMHSCVHSWAIHVLNQGWDPETAGLVLECVGSHVPDENTQEAWATRRQLMRHAARCSEYVMNGTVKKKDREWALHNLGYMFSKVGKFDEAEMMYQRALQGKEKALGPEHISTLLTVNNLGCLYRDRGRLDEAEIMYQRALQGYKKALAPEHISILDTVNNLSQVYRDRGKLDEAEIMCQRALQGYKKQLGPEHTSTLHTVNNLGILYADWGKLDEAGMMFQRAQQGYEKVIGYEAMKTYVPALNTLENLAALYARLGNRDASKKLYLRALYGVEAVFGQRSSRYQQILEALHELNNFLSCIPIRMLCQAMMRID